MDTLKKESIFLRIFKGVGIALSFTLISLTIFSVLLTYTKLQENLIQPVVISVTGISILAGSFFTTRKINRNGVLKGISVGIIYILLIYLISSIANKGSFALNLGSFIMILTGIICGAIGGIIGINIG